MSTTIIIALVAIILIILGLFSWFYLLNVYETRVLVNPKSLNVNFDSTIEIIVIPLNSFGRRILLRNISTSFEVSSGNGLVKIKEKGPDRIRLQSLFQTGKVEILVTPEFSLFPSNIVIEII